MAKDATTARSIWSRTRERTKAGAVEPPVGVSVEGFFRDHATDIHRYLFGLCRSDEDANDAVQDAFINMYKVMSKGGKIAQPRAWLVAVSRRLLINRLRKAQNDQYKHTEASRITEAIFRSSPTTHDVMEDRQRLRVLKEAINTLTPREKQCVFARAQGMKFREVSLLMDMDYRRCFDLWTSAVAKLRRAIKDADA
jgi:RNA polymerase sigma-70 factor (ECF subfamily)